MTEPRQLPCVNENKQININNEEFPLDDNSHFSVNQQLLYTRNFEQSSPPVSSVTLTNRQAHISPLASEPTLATATLSDLTLFFFTNLLILNLVDIQEV
jgi:hypothetical protein